MANKTISAVFEDTEDELGALGCERVSRHTVRGWDVWRERSPFVCRIDDRRFYFIFFLPAKWAVLGAKCVGEKVLLIERRVKNRG